MYIIPKINSSHFFFERWRAGSLLKLGLHTRKFSIIEGKNIILKYALGYCQGECLPIRQKSNAFAVMFFKDNCHFWTHFTKEEFYFIFKK